MSARYVIADLVRNPRRTLSTMIGVVLGVGLFCGVLFFVDGLSASMTQRAVEPLAIDMQRIVTQRIGAAIDLTQRFDQAELAAGEHGEMIVELHNPAEVPANEVTLRSLLDPSLSYVPGTATIDGAALAVGEIPDSDNPLAQGSARSGYNLGTIEPGGIRRITLDVEAAAPIQLDDTTVRTTYSSRESISPIAANQPPPVSLAELAEQIAALPGVERANPLVIADLGTSTLGSGDQTATGPAKIFGFSADYAESDETIVVVEGELTADGTTISAEVASALGVGIGDTITIELPDASSVEYAVSGIADLSRSRSLFSSRRGGDLETFIYTPLAVIVSPQQFTQTVFPAYERAAAAATGRLKSPPIREIDITLHRELLDADPATAAIQTERIGAAATAIAAHEDYLLDNISNTLHVAADDATVAKRLFIFLGAPGGLLAAMLAAYAGNVLAEAQRREHATLRIRGASHRHLLRMLAIRTTLLTATASILGLVTGYVTAAAILGKSSLDRASAASLATSALIGTLGGFAATGAALYLTGRRSIDREINEDRALLAIHPPLWRRARLDLAGLAIIVAGTIWALASGSFDGAPGSVYFGRAVELNLALLVLPVAVWITGSLAAARIIGHVLHRSAPASGPTLGRPAPALLRRSIGRRPWAIGNAAIVAALIVALTTSLATFTASYDNAKADDARYANGADIRITPSPTADRRYTVNDTADFETSGIARSTPVIYGLSNVVLRSDRTSDPANLAALDPDTYPQVAPLEAATAQQIADLGTGPNLILLSADMADFLKARPGDTLNVLLARATPDQTEIEVTIAGLYDRLPGFPNGADAVLDIDLHTSIIPDKDPDFFFASTTRNDEGSLNAALAALGSGPAAADSLQIDTRTSTLDRDQSSLAALNIAGLVDLDSTFALAMATVAIGIFVFGLLLQRRREYITLRAQGLEPRTIRLLIGAEAATAALTGTVAGLMVGVAMGYYFVAVLRPLFVLDPSYVIPVATLGLPVGLVLAATVISSVVGSRLVNTLEPTELLRDE